MECTSCGVQNEAGLRFCIECGTPLVQGCPSCGQPLNPAARFCGHCGTAVGAGVPAPASTATVTPLAERRMCSVLFCDLVGFTPLSEARDPEEVRELLSAYFESATTVIRRYGGIVEKFIGDAVMAVWGTPVATEGDAERAVRAAMDLMDSVRQLGVDRGIDTLAARAGVVTGEVAVTIGATNEGMVAGDAVNTAARVQTAASAGQVLVDGTTRRLAANAIAFDDPVAHVLKGKLEPEQLWRATHVMSGGVGGVQRVDGLEAPLTGRDAEMRTIRELFHAAVDRRVPRLVLVAGPAGVGKSRLGWEFRKYIDGLADVVRWHSGRCLSYGEGASFWALAEIVRQRFGIAEDDLPEAAAAKLVDGAAEWVTEPAERRYVGSRLGRLLGVPYPGDAGEALSREELFAGWRIFFERMAAVEPVVLMVEDAQHADSALLDFLDHLVDWIRDLPVYVVVFARSELEQARPGFGTGRNRVAMTVDPLDDASMHELVEALVPGLPRDARDAIVAQAQGVPLFAVETVRGLIDRDVVQPIDGVYRLVGDVGRLDVPDSLHSLLAARLDALEPRTRRLVSDAAVLGSTFPKDALDAVSGLDAVTVADALAELLRREVLVVTADPLSPERGSYAFAQELLRQVAYDTLSRRDRKARHLAVAAHLRRAFANDGEEVSDVLARHYLDALTAVPDDADADDIRDLAADVLVRAGERAERTGAPSGAATSYLRAAELVEPDDDRRTADLWERATLAAKASGDHGRTIELATVTVSRFDELGDVRSAARNRTLLGRSLRRAGRHTEAREVLHEALAELRRDPDEETVHALEAIASVENFAATPEAAAAVQEAIDLAEGLAVRPAVMAGVLLSGAIFLVTNDRVVEAGMYFEKAAELAEQGDDAALVGLCLVNLANLQLMRDPAAAADTCRRCLVVARRHGDRHMVANATVNLTFALLDLGTWDEIAPLLDQAEEAGDEIEVALARTLFFAARGDTGRARTALTGMERVRASEDPQARGAVALGDCCLAQAEGRDADVLRHGLDAVSYRDSLGIGSDPMRLAWPAATRAALELGDLAAADELVAVLDGVLPGRLPPVLRAERDLVRARLAVARGEVGAGDHLGDAVETMRGMSPPHLLAHGLLDHATYLTSQGDDAAAAVAVAEARDIGARLGCRPVLDRADALAPARSPEAV
jgi:class 3 adenylate cyclase/tetratricopeptide (TPR) repeat protein